MILLDTHTHIASQIVGNIKTVFSCEEIPRLNLVKFYTNVWQVILCQDWRQTARASISIHKIMIKQNRLSLSHTRTFIKHL